MEYYKEGRLAFFIFNDLIWNKKKISSYAHSEFNNEKYKNLDKIEYSIANKVDLFDRSINYKQVEFNQTFPDYIYKNKDKFKDWID